MGIYTGLVLSVEGWLFFVKLDIFVKVNLSVFGVLALFSGFFYKLGWIGHATGGSLQGQCEWFMVCDFDLSQAHKTELLGEDSGIGFHEFLARLHRF